MSKKKLLFKKNEPIQVKNSHHRWYSCHKEKKGKTMTNKSEIFSILIPTLNNMGYMFEDLTEYGDEFIRFSQDAKDPALDIAAAYGIATLKLLQQQIRVVANDLDPRHLEILRNQV